MCSQVSVIIPAYNAAKTVEKTIRSVLASTIPVEVWVTDDGSRDSTGGILDRIALSEKRVHVIHQCNKGAYAARLAALQLIKTPFFGFVDADDTIDPTMFEKMLEFAVRENLDVVQVGIDGAENQNFHLSEKRSVITGSELESWKCSYLVDGREGCFIWDKLYRNQYSFDAFEHPERLTNYDDMIFNFQFLRKVARMGFIQERLYHYADTEGGAVRSYGRRKFHDACWMLRNHWRLTKQLFEASSIEHGKLWIGHMKWVFRNIRTNVISFARARRG